MTCMTTAGSVRGGTHDVQSAHVACLVIEAGSFTPAAGDDIGCAVARSFPTAAVDVAFIPARSCTVAGNVITSILARALPTAGDDNASILACSFASAAGDDNPSTDSGAASVDGVVSTDVVSRYKRHTARLKRANTQTATLHGGASFILG